VIVYGLNPVLEAIRARPAQIRFVGVSTADKARLAKLISEAKDAGIQVRIMPGDQIRRFAGGKVHNGVVAEISDASYADLSEVLRSADPPRRIFALDGVQDPQNLGAILRVADGFGFGLVVIPRHDSVGLTATAVKASAGAVEWVPVAQVTNLARALEELKASGYWVYAATADGEAVSRVDFADRVVLVLGSEGRGVRRNVLEHSDQRVAIPMRGSVGSFNVATAAAVLAYEVDRQAAERSGRA
jgi:23S rRNA (guanosine2251-2'-O)-methyltransferase